MDYLFQVSSLLTLIFMMLSKKKQQQPEAVQEEISLKSHAVIWKKIGGNNLNAVNFSRGEANK